VRVNVGELIGGLATLAVGVSVISLRRNPAVGSWIQSFLTKGRSGSDGSQFPPDYLAFPVWAVVAVGLVLCVFGLGTIFYSILGPP
jgi:hypothetical protein